MKFYLYIFSKYSPWHRMQRSIIWNHFEYAVHHSSLDMLQRSSTYAATAASDDSNRWPVFYPLFSGKKKVTRSQIWTVGWMKQNLYSWFPQKCFVCTVGRSIVVVEKDSTQACVWSFPPTYIEDFGQTFCYIPICSDSSLIFQCKCSNMTSSLLLEDFLLGRYTQKTAFSFRDRTDISSFCHLLWC